MYGRVKDERLENLDPLLFGKFSVVFAQDSELACLARGMPHMRSLNGDHKVHPIVLLKDRKFGRIRRVRSWHSFAPPLNLWLVRRVKLELKPGAGK